jgi:hypothetical protein
MGNHPQMGLAKFGYKFKKEVEIFAIPPILWQQDRS